MIFSLIGSPDRLAGVNFARPPIVIYPVLSPRSVGDVRPRVVRGGVTVFRLTSICRVLPASRKKVVWAALGIGGLALIVAASAGSGPAKNSPPVAEGKTAGKPAEAPTGFDNKTNGFEDQAGFDKDRESFEEVESSLRARSSTRPT
jgi:hypothetical protein